VRPPGEIAADLSRLAVTWYLDLPAGAEDLLREAAEALRAQHRELNRDAGDSMFLSEIVSDLERERNQAGADRDALLSVVKLVAPRRARFRSDPAVLLRSPEEEDIDRALAALPEHLRQQVER
jgi:hypothetical protein